MEDDTFNTYKSKKGGNLMLKTKILYSTFYIQFLQYRLHNETKPQFQKLYNRAINSFTKLSIEIANLNKSFQTFIPFATFV